MLNIRQYTTKLAIPRGMDQAFIIVFGSHDHDGEINR